MRTDISFDDTETAFAHKTDKELKQAHWLFSTMRYQALVKLGTAFTPWAIRSGLPVSGLVRSTIFKQFVGGETLEQTIPVVEKLRQFNVQAILDYGVEGKTGEKNYDQACKEFIRVIEFAASQPGIPFMSVKVTGIARFSLLEKLDYLMHAAESGSLLTCYNIALQQLSIDELEEWDRVYHRMKKISIAASEANVGFLVDAEETWIQDPVDALTILMMEEYNNGRLVVYNTVQLYRHDRLKFLINSFEVAKAKNFLLGAKLVRGAYMEKERRRAKEKKYTSPIQVDKAATDADFNDAVKFCIDNIDGVGIIVATHNEHSNLLATQLLQDRGLPLDHPHVHFSQLYGMSDNITYNLAKAGCSVSKYLPFGPIKDVVPYLMRRAQENTSVGGQTGRELKLLDTEIKRRQELRKRA